MWEGEEIESETECEAPIEDRKEALSLEWDKEPPELAESHFWLELV